MSAAWDAGLREAEELADVSYPDDSRVDWEDFIDRLERSTDWDFGKTMDSPDIRRLQRHIRAYRRAG